MVQAYSHKKIRLRGPPRRANKLALPACRIFPISSEYCTARHGAVRSQANTQITLRHSAFRAQLTLPSVSLCPFVNLSLRTASEATPVRTKSHCSCLSRSRISDREFPATAAVTRTLALSFPGRPSQQPSSTRTYTCQIRPRLLPLLTPFIPLPFRGLVAPPGWCLLA